MDDAKNTRFHTPTGLRFMTLLILVIILQYKSDDVHVWVVQDNGTLAMQSEVSKGRFFGICGVEKMQPAQVATLYRSSNGNIVAYHL